MSSKIEKYDIVDYKNVEPIKFDYNPPYDFEIKTEKSQMFDIEIDEKLKESGKPHRIIRKYRLIND